MAGILIREFLILFLILVMSGIPEFLKFTLPVFLTFNQVKEEEVNITRAYLQIKVNHYPSYVRIVSLS